VNEVILVAPPSPLIVLPEAASFYPIPLNGENLADAADETWFVHSTNDPFCSIDDTTHYLKLGVSAIAFPKMGHINTASGYGVWP
jgi:predicted alpha/beta hydrolase family esterase